MDFIGLITSIPFIIIGALGVGFLVGFHELGHFLFCKLYGVKTPSFSIGFGPQLIKKRIGDTVFILSALPLGGYVEIAGADEPGQGEQQERSSKASDSFAVKPYYQKMLIISGGILFNLIFAYAAVSIAFFVGIPETPLLLPFNSTSIVKKVDAHSPAERAGLQEGDEIIAVQINDNHIHVDEKSSVPFIKQALESIHTHPETVADITIRRDADLITKKVLVGTKQGKGFIGAGFKTHAIEPQGYYEACLHGIRQVHFWMYSTLQALSTIFTEKNVENIGGPVMVISQMIKEAEKGPVPFLLLLALISINLAVMNIIPLPVFDGGQALFYTIEALIGRRLPETVRTYIAYGTWLLLLVLIIYTTLKDISKLIES